MYEILAPPDAALRPAPPPAPPARRWPLLALCLALAVLAAPPRLARLGALSFYADEDLTALAARSVAAGLPSQMPSGMAYNRALPYTWLTALAGELFGGPEEVAYRLPAALIGILSVPLFFLLARRLAPARVAGVAALLLALSEWHLVYSRHARMYGPFLLCFLAAAVLLVCWTRSGRRSDLLGGVLAFGAAVSLHALALFALVPAAAALLLPAERRVPVRRVFGVLLLLAIAAVAFDRLIVASRYAEWHAQLPKEGAGAARDGLGWLRSWLATLGPIAWASALVGGAAGVEAVRRAEPADGGDGWWLRRAVRLGGGVVAGVLLGLGQLYGAALVGTAVLLIHPAPRREIARRARTPLAALGVFMLGWCMAAPVLWGARGAIRWMFSFPFPYGGGLATQFIGVALLATAAGAGLVLRKPTRSDWGLRVSLLGVIVALLALGTVSRWGGTRYLFFAYPFILLLASAALLAGLDRIARHWSRWSSEASVLVAAVLVASGVLGGHGVPQTIRTVLLRHGQPVDGELHGFAFRPDHRSVGEALHRQRRPDDIVIAEDATQVYLYAGRVDYWLRSRADARRYLYRDDRGVLRDFYVGSALAETPVVLDSVVSTATGRVWLVTSGETTRQRRIYLTPEQAEWLGDIESRREPLSTGEDGVSRLYCLNCATDHPGS